MTSMTILAIGDLILHNITPSLHWQNEFIHLLDYQWKRQLKDDQSKAKQHKYEQNTNTNNTNTNENTNTDTGKVNEAGEQDASSKHFAATRGGRLLGKVIIIII